MYIAFLADELRALLIFLFSNELITWFDFL